MTSNRVREGQRYLLRLNGRQVPVQLLRHQPRSGMPVEMVNVCDGTVYSRRSVRSLSLHYDGCCLHGCGCAQRLAAERP